MRIHAREILDSRGQPTLEVDLIEGDRLARAAVPSGASCGSHEAYEKRDGEVSWYAGRGVRRLAAWINETLDGKLVPGDQQVFDQRLLEIDGTPDKSRLGANTILALSMAHARLVSKESALFRSFGSGVILPVPLLNIFNGGKHANSGSDIQEYMVAPVGARSFSEALEMGVAIMRALKGRLQRSGMSTAVGDEGGFAPRISSHAEVFELILQSVEDVGLQKDVFLALDCAATEWFQDGYYHVEGKKSSAEVISLLASWVRDYRVASIEDGLAEDDWDGWKLLKSQLGHIQLVGDDLFVTKSALILQGKDAANAVLIKCNQVGTLTETMAAITAARSLGFASIMSHRSGETTDDMIADLAVGLGVLQIKTGAPCRGERIAKYNQLLRIEELLGVDARYAGRSAFLSS